MLLPVLDDVFLQYNAELRRFAHTGIVVKVDFARGEGDARWYECTTIEANTNEAGNREGDGVFCQTRRLYPALGDRFVRWVDLDARESAAA